MQGVPPFQVADGAAVTAAATLTDASPLPNVYLPAGLIGDYPGIRLEVQASGVYTTNATAATITFGLYSGTVGQAIGSAVSLGASSAVTLVASQTNKPWRMEGSVQIRTIGTSGTGYAVLEASGLTSGGLDFAMTAAGSTFTIDTTVARYLTLGVNISTAQSFTCRYFGAKLVN